MKEKAKVAVIGVTGFTGERLANILLQHPQVQLNYVTARLPQPKPLAEIFSYLEKKTDLLCCNFKIKEAVKKADLFFLSLPHTVSFTLAPLLLKAGKKVIDLSADYRLKDPLVYKKYYQKTHRDKKNLKNAVYGLPEFLFAEIKKTKLVANPGCYPTAVLLVLLPLLREKLVKEDFLLVDAKSGVSGAGRKALLDYHFANLSGNMWAYKPYIHQHTAEINQQIMALAKSKAQIKFCPHLIPVERGIMVSAYFQLKKTITEKKIKNIYLKYYRQKAFVRIRDYLPPLKSVYNTNFCDIGLAVEKKDLMVVGVIDNLMKGAASQAVQNMNIMLGLDEKTGIF